MLQIDVRDFVAEHELHFGVSFREVQQPAIYVDVSAYIAARVYFLVFNDEELIADAGSLALL